MAFLFRCFTNLPRSFTNRSSRNRIFVATTLFLVLLLSACATVVSSPSPVPSTTISPSAIPPPPADTTFPTQTPTPLPEVLTVDLASYLSPDSAFSIKVPASWKPTDIGGGIRFQETEFSPTSVTAHFLLLPVTADAGAYVSDIISQTYSIVQYNNADNFLELGDELMPNGHRQIEFLGQLDPANPMAHVLAELWVESNTLLGLSLTAPADNWAQVLPLWDLLIESYQPKAVDIVRNSFGLNYVHPTGLFTITVPVGWGIVEEYPEEGEVLLSDISGYAQFSVSANEMTRRPTPSDLATALNDLMGDVTEQEGYEELRNEEPSVYERIHQFEILTADDGFYRTELRAMSDGNRLVTTSFNAPPHDWEVFAPAYELMLSSLQLALDAPPDEATQDADPVAGIKVGEPMSYLARGGRLWVSAPIINNRTRTLNDLTAAVELYDENDTLLAAESWRLGQKRVGAGATTYLTLDIGSDVAPIKKASYVLVNIVDAKDTAKDALRLWGYEGGSANINDAGDAVLKVTMRNATNSIQKRIYIVALLYDENGDLSFAKAAPRRLPHAVPPGETVNLKITIAGPHSGLTGFDIIGEVPK